MDFGVAGTGRLLVALAVLGALALLAWGTMEAGKPRTLTWVLLGFFGVRVGLGRMRAGR